MKKNIIIFSLDSSFGARFAFFFFFLIIISSLDSLFGAHFALFFNQLLYSFSKSEAIVSPLSKIVLLRHSFFVNWKCPHLC